MELVNTTATQKILTIGQMAGLKQGSRVIDFGCGFGEVLSLWARTHCWRASRPSISQASASTRNMALERADAWRGLGENSRRT